MSQDQEYNPVCVCGHPQSKHPCIRPFSVGEVQTKCKECKCWRFRLPEEEQA